MSIITIILTTIVALEHFYIFYLEVLPRNQMRLVVYLIWKRKNWLIRQ
ncbi:Predicted membrane protein [Streptococcus pneumoniae]|uniref:Predicted membrane protein n=1 Tax=Streptococcus pneumoniae TaxID=1313 RepID=A0A0T8C062_STREE|nr:Predicted membrane protein [Streptococcus pneumoniae]CIS47625.1 Predicted membrane protein [Streptococcus pneumoniae]CIY95647.1 Predicted membrane protein [Streptococcus pneumoniae]CJV27337.1 Predicted membrane protein [Streptococcus pneumoniae]CJX09649.1 Predicted membrane protein [Streptococcus pneumoniae]